MAGSESEAALIERATIGDITALTLVLQQRRAELVRTVRAMLPDEGGIDAEDIVQDALIAAFRKIHTFKPGGDGSFSGWLVKIAENQLHDRQRAARRLKRGGGQADRSISSPFTPDTVAGLLEVIAAPMKTPGSHAARGEAIKAILVELDNLPDEQQRALWLVYGEGMSIAAAATALAKTQGAVRGLSARGLKTLRARFRGSGVFSRPRE